MNRLMNTCSRLSMKCSERLLKEQKRGAQSKIYFFFPSKLKPNASRLPLFEAFGVPIIGGRLFTLSHFPLVAIVPEHFKGNKVATGYFLERITDN